MDLADYRKEIDDIDRQIVDLFQKRMRVAEGIAVYKKEHDVPVLDSGREKEKLQNILQMADEDMASYLEMLYNNIMMMSKDHQKKFL